MVAHPGNSSARLSGLMIFSGVEALWALLLFTGLPGASPHQIDGGTSWGRLGTSIGLWLFSGVEALWALLLFTGLSGSLAPPK